MKRAYVVWEDAADLDEGPWVDRATAVAHKPVIFHQVGYVYSLTPSELILTACIGEEQMGVRSVIPIGMVRSLIELVDGSAIPIPKKRRRK